ncbi:hypothetical protein FM113_14165 [Leucobacter sp. 7(1)]|nr:hypothetical protein FM113_14165 [Leucobacter sp. 7(1)]
MLLGWGTVLGCVVIAGAVLTGAVLGADPNSAGPPDHASPQPTLHASINDPAPSAADTAASNTGVSSNAVRDQLAGLRSVSGVSAAPYDRARFGQAWFDADRNGCDTRNDVLRRDLVDVELKPGTRGCKVLAGRLDDWYSGTTLDFVAGQQTSERVQIDHVVPLSWAWKHGAAQWESDALRAFANDPANLVATSGQQNRQKSDSGPADWMPADATAHCAYVERFTGVLVAYELGITERERAAIDRVLARAHCGEQG